MFLDFFFDLKAAKLPVSLSEWMTVTEALVRGEIATLDDFYFVSRALLVKRENHFDLFDRVFLSHFKNAPFPEPFLDSLLDWLKSPIARRQFSPEELSALQKLPREELLRLLEERLKEQRERHDGGNKWIGTGGTSPFGHSGYNPQGIRIGGQSMNRSAMKVAAERRFRNYRSDLILDTRQIKVALKKLRLLRRDGVEEELDLDGTIEKTAKGGGDIDIVLKPPRKNDLRVLLLMDVGGTMDPYAHLVDQLFSAAHASTHFKDFQHFYFHNCVYSSIFSDMERGKRIPTADLFRRFGKHYRLIVVGDAAMNPYELLYSDGVIDFHAPRESHSGLHWLQALETHYSHAVWLNPEPAAYWYSETTQVIRQLFPMFPLTLDGLEEAIRALRAPASKTTKTF